MARCMGGFFVIQTQIYDNNTLYCISVYSKTPPYDHPENETTSLLRALFERPDFFAIYFNGRNPRYYGHPAIP